MIFLAEVASAAILLTGAALVLFAGAMVATMAFSWVRLGAGQRNELRRSIRKQIIAFAFCGALLLLLLMGMALRSLFHT